MFSIISCTNRKNSKTYSVSKYIFEIYKKFNFTPSHLLDLQTIPLFQIEEPYKKATEIQKEINLLNQSQGIILIIPEYNGSYPGIFKYFVDHWDEKKTFAFKPYCLIGIGNGLKGGIQALKHMQNILFHRKAFIYPEFTLINSEDIQDKQILKSDIVQRLEKQAQGFYQFSKNNHPPLLS